MNVFRVERNLPLDDVCARRRGEYLSEVIGTLEGLASQFGYLGIFAVSALGSAIPFVPLPYLLVVILVSGSYNPLLLGLAAGVGGAAGKVTSYLLGRFGYRMAAKETRGNLDALHDVLAKYGALGVFVFAVTPLPDDVYIIPMGIIRLPFWRFFVASLAGKVILSMVVASLGNSYFASVGALLGDSPWVTAAAVVLTMVLSLLMMRADWNLAIRVVRARGVRGFLGSLPEVLRFRRSPEQQT